jgi:uncharacterized protein (TIGR03118 family)
MKILFTTKILLAGFLVITCIYACKKDHKPVLLYNIKQTNLVADVQSTGAAHIDTALVNAWGIAASPTGIIWTANNHTATSSVYDTAGNTKRPPVTIPSVTPGVPGAPTGIIFNGTTDFGANRFIFAGEDGVITGWASGNAAVKVADRSTAGAVYKGMTMGTDGGANFLYATNFKGQRIDVFDANFNYVTTKPFLDPGIPAGYGPFGIQNIGGQLYVTYAKLKAPDNMDDDPGLGNGYVDVFTTGGTLVKRFASMGALNSPWGIALAPAGFAGETASILIGNFGDGHISVFDMTGQFRGQLQYNGHLVVIDGLWAIDFLKNNAPGGNPNDKLFFTAGPNGESDGLLGYLQKQ